MQTDKLKAIDIKKRNGFSFVEVLVAILLTGLVITLSIPVMTQMSRNMTGQDKNTIDCINSNAVDVVTNAASGAITQPTAFSSCGGAIASCKNGSCDSLKYLADNGSAAQQTAARRVLRATCDIGGEEACDYFIARCKADANLCTSSEPHIHLNFYLDKSITTNSIVGVQVVSSALLKLYDTFDSAFNANLLNQFKNYACPTNINSIGCNIFLNHMQPLIINKCNQGDASYCSFAYTYNLNRSCNQIKQSWNGAVDGPYTITTSTSATYRTNCDMTTDDGGWTQVAAVNGGLVIMADHYTSGYGTPLTGTSWFLSSNKFDTFSAPVMRINMGTSRSYFRPSGTSLFSQMVASHTLHKWANNYKDPFVYPLYYEAHLGGSQRVWTNFSGNPYGNNATNLSGAHLHFWGGNNAGTPGGYGQQAGIGWWQSFTMWVKETSSQVTGSDCNNLQAKFTSPADAPSGKYVLDNGTTAYCGMNRHRSCLEWFNGNTQNVTGNSDVSNITEYRTSGIYWINPTRTTGAQFPAYCDMTTDGGGWTLIVSSNSAGTPAITESVGLASNNYLSSSKVQALANISTTVKIATRDNTTSIKSTDATAITNLRALKIVNANAVAELPTLTQTHWTGVGSTALEVNNFGGSGCENIINSPYPGIFHACGNGANLTLGLVPNQGWFKGWGTNQSWNMDVYLR
jgi:hypothetical protein